MAFLPSIDRSQIINSNLDMVEILVAVMLDRECFFECFFVFIECFDKSLCESFEVGILEDVVGDAFFVAVLVVTLNILLSFVVLFL